MAARAVLLKIV